MCNCAWLCYQLVSFCVCTFEIINAVQFVLFQKWEEYSLRLDCTKMDCTEMKVLCVWRFLCGSHALFIRPTSTDFSKFFFKTGSHGTIHIFKNYFTTMFSVFSNKRYLNRFIVYFFTNAHVTYNSEGVTFGLPNWFSTSLYELIGFYVYLCWS